MDMFANYEKLIAAQSARIARLELALETARAEHVAAKNMYDRMRSEVPKETSKR